MNFLRFCFLFLLVFPLFSQENEPVDSLSRREAYEAEVRKMRMLEKLRIKDPKRFRDSLEQVYEERRYAKALDRIESYLSDPELANRKELDLSGARLDSIPAFVFQAKSMEALVLDYNRIHTLPKRLSELPRLKRIYWKNNGLGDVSIKIPRLETITKLDLSGNNLEKLPKVHRFTNLQELVLENNAFSKLPTWRGRRLKRLHELDISGNPLVLDRRWYWLLKRYKVLRLNKCEISEIHPSFFKMSGLEELQLQVNNLTELPEGISGLTRLSKLSFYKNSLDSLPADFFELKNLEIIDLYYNSFEKIPAEIGQLSNLRTLYLSFNRIYDLPSTLGDLKALEELYIHHNRLSELPPQIGSLQKLKVLHFQNTYVSEVPSFLSKIKSLRDLDISETYISSIPEGLATLPLEFLYWRNLEISIDDPKNKNTKNTLMKLQSRGTNVVPTVEIKRLQIQDSRN